MGLGGKYWSNVSPLRVAGEEGGGVVAMIAYSDQKSS